MLKPGWMKPLRVQPKADNSLETTQVTYRFPLILKWAELKVVHKNFLHVHQN